MNIRQTDEINPVLGNQQQYIEEEEVLRIVLPKSRLPSSSLFYDSTIPTTSTQVNPAVLAGPLSCSEDQWITVSWAMRMGVTPVALVMAPHTSTLPKFASLLIYLFFNSTISSTQLVHYKEWVGGCFALPVKMSCIPIRFQLPTETT